MKYYMSCRHVVSSDIGRAVKEYDCLGILNLGHPVIGRGHFWF
jgi:hypothetical protein